MMIIVGIVAVLGLLFLLWVGWMFLLGMFVTINKGIKSYKLSEHQNNGLKEKGKESSASTFAFKDPKIVLLYVIILFIILGIVAVGAQKLKDYQELQELELIKEQEEEKSREREKEEAERKRIREKQQAQQKRVLEEERRAEEERKAAMTTEEKLKVDAIEKLDSMIQNHVSKIEGYYGEVIYHITMSKDDPLIHRDPEWIKAVDAELYNLKAAGDRLANLSMVIEDSDIQQVILKINKAGDHVIHSAKYIYRDVNKKGFHYADGIRSYSKAQDLIEEANEMLRDIKNNTDFY